MLKMNVRALMEARGYERPWTTLLQEGFSSRIASRLLDNALVISLEHLEKLCILLKCEPNDLLVWTADGHTQYPADLPLKKLEPRSTPSLTNMLQNLPFDQLKTLLDEVQQKIK